MAKVNDGNLLQHFVECALAEALTEGTKTLHLLATHAMAPFEATDVATTDNASRGLRALLAALPEAPASAVERAYTRTKASPEHYPNTAELLAALLGDETLRGVLCEFDGPSTTALQKRWAGSGLQVRGGSWRATMKEGAFDATPEEGTAWLFTLDPYTWLLPRELRGGNRGPNLCREDLQNCRTLLGSYAQGDAPGALCAFVYKVDPEHRADFRRTAIGLADRLGFERAFLGLPAADGTRHLAVVMSPTPGLVAGIAEAWTHFREANALS